MEPITHFDLTTKKLALTPRFLAELEVVYGNDFVESQIARLNLRYSKENAKIPENLEDYIEKVIRKEKESSSLATKTSVGSAPLPSVRTAPPADDPPLEGGVAALIERVKEEQRSSSPLLPKKSAQEVWDETRHSCMAVGINLHQWLQVYFLYRERTPHKVRWGADRLRLSNGTDKEEIYYQEHGFKEQVKLAWEWLGFPSLDSDVTLLESGMSKEQKARTSNNGFFEYKIGKMKRVI